MQETRRSRRYLHSPFDRVQPHGLYEQYPTPSDMKSEARQDSCQVKQQHVPKFLRFSPFRDIAAQCRCAIFFPTSRMFPIGKCTVSTRRCVLSAMVVTPPTLDISAVFCDIGSQVHDTVDLLRVSSSSGLTLQTVAILETFRLVGYISCKTGQHGIPVSFCAVTVRTSVTATV